MDRKISLNITAAADGAVKEIKKITAAQDGLKKSASALQDELREANRAAKDIAGHKTLQNAHRLTQSEIEHTKKQLVALADKQKQNIQLTQAESVKLAQHKNVLENLNAKKSQGLTLTLSEQNRLIKSKAVVSELTEKKSSLYKLTAKEQKQVISLTKRMDKLTAQEKQQNTELTKQAAKLDKAGVNTRNLSMAKDIANRKAQKAAQLLERENRLLDRSNKLQAKRKDMLGSMPDANLTAGVLLAGGAVAGRQSMTNQSDFIDVQKTLKAVDENGNSRQISEAETAKARADLNAIAVDMAGVSQSDVMKIAAGGSRGGITIDKLPEFVRNTIMTSTAWDMTAEDAAKKGADLRNSLGYKDDVSTKGVDEGMIKYMRMANQINTIANDTDNVEARDLLGVMSRQGATLINSGFSNEQALALSGGLLSKGATEEQAATAAKNISKALTRGFSASDAQKDVFRMIGMSAGTVAQSTQDDAMGTLLDVLDGVKDLNAEDQAAALNVLFGDEAVGHVQKLLNDTESLRAIELRAQKARNDSVKAEYELVASSNAAKYEETANALNNFAIVMGDRLLPIVEPLRAGLTDGVMALTEFMAANEWAGTAIATASAAVVGGIAAYKAYHALKFAKGLIGIAKETAALNKAANARERYTRSLNREAVANESGGRRGGRGGRRRGRRRGRGRGLLKVGAGLLAGGFASSAFAGDSMDVAADGVGAVGDLLENAPKAGGMVKGFAKGVRPLAMLMDGVSAAGSLIDGDYRSAAETGGGFLGGMGGAAAGAALGTMIFPGVGTAVGAGLGGLLGDNLGADLFAGAFDWFSSEEVPDHSEQIMIAQQKEAAARQTPAKNETFSPQIYLQGGVSSEQDMEPLLAKMREKWDEWNAERDAELNQDLKHSMVS